MSGAGPPAALPSPTAEPSGGAWVDVLAGAAGEALVQRADERTRAWWERYLKGAVPFRGVPMAGIREVAWGVWRAHLEKEDHHRRWQAVDGLFAGRFCEDKLTAILLLAEPMLPTLTDEDLPRLAAPLADGRIADWNTCDWYCVKTLARFITSAPDPRARAAAIAGWTEAATLWQRRAAAVSLVPLASRGDAAFPGLGDILVGVCAANVRDPSRFMQTSVGWSLRELSMAEPELVEQFVRGHGAAMSAEALRAATAKLPAAVRDELGATRRRRETRPRGPQPD